MAAWTARAYWGPCSRSYPRISTSMGAAEPKLRILNFGSAAPIDVEILGYDLEQGPQYARAVHAAMRNLAAKDGQPLLTDVQISREENYPHLDVQGDPGKAGRP